MRREHDWLLEHIQRIEDAGQTCGLVGVLGSMYGRQNILTGPDANRGEWLHDSVGGRIARALPP